MNPSTDHLSRPARRTDVRLQHKDDGHALYDPGCGAVHLLNDTALAVWELCDGTKDWTQARDLAEQMPEKLTELHRLFAIEAVKYNVFPLDDRMVERIDPAVSGRPALVKGHSQLFFPGTGRLPEAAVVNIGHPLAAWSVKTACGTCWRQKARRSSSATLHAGGRSPPGGI